MNNLLKLYYQKKILNILVIDTSSNWIYCGIYKIQVDKDLKYQILDQDKYVEYAYRNSFQKIGGYLQSLFNHFNKIDLIICGIGPGSFTGVRISVSTARNLSQFLNIPTIGIDSLTLYSYGIFRQLDLSQFYIGFDGKQNKIYLKHFLKESFLNTEIYDKPILEVQEILNKKQTKFFIDNIDIFKNNIDENIQLLPFLDMKHFIDLIFYNDFIKINYKFFKKNYKEILPIYLRKDPASEKYPEGLKRDESKRNFIFL